MLHLFVPWLAFTVVDVIAIREGLLGFGVLYFNTLFGSGFLLLLLIT